MKGFMNYYPFHIGDYISHTSHLTDEEDLAYRRMIDLYYHSEQPFPDEFFVARRVKSNPAVALILLQEFFELQDDGWHNKRADEEIAKYQAKADSARNANRIKSEKHSILKSTLESEPNQLLTNNQKPITNNHIKNIDPPDGVSVDLWKDFLVYRKRMKSPVTPRVLARLIKEADIAKMSLSDVLETIIFKGWKSFDASWVAQKQSGSAPQSNQAWRTNDNLMIAKANELGLHTVGLQRFEIINKIDATLRSRGL